MSTFIRLQNFGHLQRILNPKVISRINFMTILSSNCDETLPDQ